MRVILHNVRSAHNVGSIFRTADAAGIRKIYLCGITPEPLDKFGKVRNDFAKVALGAEKYVEWGKYHSTIKLLNKLKRDDCTIIAIEQAKRSIPYYSLKNRNSKLENAVLVLGNEVRGLPSFLLKYADVILEIPMSGRKESLNVSVAFGIVAFHLRFTRTNGNRIK